LGYVYKIGAKKKFPTSLHSIIYLLFFFYESLTFERGWCRISLGLGDEISKYLIEMCVPVNDEG